MPGSLAVLSCSEGSTCDERTASLFWYSVRSRWVVVERRLVDDGSSGDPGIVRFG